MFVGMQQQQGGLAGQQAGPQPYQYSGYAPNSLYGQQQQQAPQQQYGGNQYGQYRQQQAEPAAAAARPTPQAPVPSKQVHSAVPSQSSRRVRTSNCGCDVRRLCLH